ASVGEPIAEEVAAVEGDASPEEADVVDGADAVEAACATPEDEDGPDAPAYGLPLNAVERYRRETTTRRGDRTSPATRMASRLTTAARRGTALGARSLPARPDVFDAHAQAPLFHDRLRRGEPHAARAEDDLSARPFGGLDEAPRLQPEKLADRHL